MVESSSLRSLLCWEIRSIVPCVGNHLDGWFLGRSVCRGVGRSEVRSVGRLVGRSTGGSVVRTADRSGTGSATHSLRLDMLGSIESAPVGSGRVGLGRVLIFYTEIPVCASRDYRLFHRPDPTSSLDPRQECPISSRCAPCRLVLSHLVPSSHSSNRPAASVHVQF